MRLAAPLNSATRWTIAIMSGVIVSSTIPLQRETDLRIVSLHDKYNCCGAMILKKYCCRCSMYRYIGTRGQNPQHGGLHLAMWSSRRFIFRNACCQLPMGVMVSVLRLRVPGVPHEPNLRDEVTDDMLAARTLCKLHTKRCAAYSSVCNVSEGTEYHCVD